MPFQRKRCAVPSIFFDLGVSFFRMTISFCLSSFKGWDLENWDATFFINSVAEVGFFLRRSLTKSSMLSLVHVQLLNQFSWLYGFRNVVIHSRQNPLGDVMPTIQNNLTNLIYVLMLMSHATHSLELGHSDYSSI